MQLSSDQIEGLGKAVLKALLPGDQDASYLAFGEHRNAIVLYFDYRETHAEDIRICSLDDAMEKLLDNRGEDIANAIDSWFEDEMGDDED